MSRIIAKAAIRGAHRMVERADEALAKAIEAKGKDEAVAYPNTAYYLPIMYLFLGQKVEKLGDLEESMQEARKLLGRIPDDKMWLPYLGDTLDSGVATLIAEETIEALKLVTGPNPVDGIWLGYTDDSIDLVRADPQARTHPSDGRIRCGHKRVCSVVHIQECPLSSLKKHGLAGLQPLIENTGNIFDVRPDLCSILHILIICFPCIDLRCSIMRQKNILLRDVHCDFLFENRRIKQVADSYATPGHLIHISGTDPSHCCTDLLTTHPLFTNFLPGRMIGENQMGILANPDVFVHLYAHLPQLSNLFQECPRIENNAIPDQAEFIRMEDS